MVTLPKRGKIKDLMQDVEDAINDIPGHGGGGGGASWGSITGTLSSQSDLQTALNSKQDDLISGTNIKTVNGESLLGSGNIAFNYNLDGGSSASTYGGANTIDGGGASG